MRRNFTHWQHFDDDIVNYICLPGYCSTAGEVDIYRNGQLIANSADGTYTDNLGRVSGTFVYQVCESSVCSNKATVVF